MDICTNHLARISSPEDPPFPQGIVIDAVAGVPLSTNKNSDGIDIRFTTKPNETTWINWPVPGLGVC